MLFSLLFAAACSSSSTETTAIQVADYDRRCADDDDCVLAIDGDVCGGCPNAAVAKSDTRYVDDRHAIAMRCPNAGTVGAPQCEPRRATCTAGLCGASP